MACWFGRDTMDADGLPPLRGALPPAAVQAFPAISVMPSGAAFIKLFLLPRALFCPCVLVAVHVFRLLVERKAFYSSIQARHYGSRISLAIYIVIRWMQTLLSPCYWKRTRGILLPLPLPSVLLCNLTYLSLSCCGITAGAGWTGRRWRHFAASSRQGRQ